MPRPKSPRKLSPVILVGSEGSPRLTVGQVHELARLLGMGPLIAPTTEVRAALDALRDEVEHARVVHALCSAAREPTLAAKIAELVKMHERMFMFRQSLSGLDMMRDALGPQLIQLRAWIQRLRSEQAAGARGRPRRSELHNTVTYLALIYAKHETAELSPRRLRRFLELALHYLVIPHPDPSKYAREFDALLPGGERGIGASPSP